MKRIYIYRKPFKVNIYSSALYKNGRFKNGVYLIVSRGFSGAFESTVLGRASLDCTEEEILTELEASEEVYVDSCKICKINPVHITEYIKPPLLIDGKDSNYINNSINEVANKISNAYCLAPEMVRVGATSLDHGGSGVILLVTGDINVTEQDLLARYHIDVTLLPYKDFLENYAIDVDTVNEHIIKRKTEQLMKTLSFKDLYAFMSSLVLGQPDLDLVCVGVYTYLRAIASGNEPHRSNILITGSTGVGKTQTYRALKNFIEEKIPEMPVGMEDLSLITEAGFKGRDPVRILDILFSAESGGYGIVFLDEFDKKVIPSYDSQGSNVNLAVLNQILTMTEGGVFKRGDDSIIDTTKTLFIFSGSFEELRSERDRSENLIGFGMDYTDRPSHDDTISRNELLDYGFPVELLGRIPIIASYGHLSKEIKEHIIYRVIGKLSDNLKIKIEVKENLLSYLLEANNECGARMYDAMITPVVYKAYAEGIIKSDAFAIILDWDAVKLKIKYGIRRRWGNNAEHT